MSILISWAVLTLGMWIATSVLSHMKIEGGLGSHVLVAGGFGLLLALTGWFFHLALGFLSFGILFALSFVAQVIVGAIVLKITDAFSERLRVDGFGTALLASLIITGTGSVATAILAHA